VVQEKHVKKLANKFRSVKNDPNRGEKGAVKSIKEKLRFDFQEV
jgi:hypothetical protein